MTSPSTRFVRRAARLLVVPTLVVGFASTSAFAQLAPAAGTAESTPAADPKKVPVETVPADERTSASRAEGEPVTLSPFEVKADAKGYFQANAMSGTRLNSRIEDLGQSITVMTKEQMADFAMLDINDVFDQMVGTEGTRSFSDFSTDRTGAVTDNVSLDPNNANRVRGIGNANIALNNIAMTGRVPVDPLWIDSLEVSRGANANIFGLGNAGGTVNQVPATANLRRDFAKTEMRGDSYGGWRTSLDVNRTLIKDRLALRASYAYQHTAFQRKPAGEDSRRLSMQLKFRPYENTTVSFSWFNYKNAQQRPNYTTPRDNVTSWIAAGRPAWDPVTRFITINGVTYGQGTTAGSIAAGSTTPITTLPSYFNNSPTDGRSILRVGDSGYYWTAPTINTSTTTPFSGGSTSGIRLISTSAVGLFGATQPLFATFAAINDKSIYDYENISLMSANKAWDDTDIFMGQVDQVFLNTPRQTLAAQLTAMREDSSRIENLPLGPASVNGIIGDLYYDPNLRNLDGTVNPYFGRPYLRSKEPFLRNRPMLWDTGRAQLAYRLDFSKDSGLTKWLGTQQILGYYEYKDQKNYHYAFRRTANSYSSQPYLQGEFARNAPLANRTTAGTYIASNNLARIYELYYVGSTPGGGIEYGPATVPDTVSTPFVWGNTGSFRADPLTIGWTPSPDGFSHRQTVVKTGGGMLQSFFLNGKVITVVGRRTDKVFDHNNIGPFLTSDFLDIDYGASGTWQPTWRMAKGSTDNFQVVLRPFQDAKWVDRLANQGSVARFASGALKGFSPFYNKGNNFIAQGPAFDLFLKSLPNQTGTTKDIGFWIYLFDNRLSIRYTHQVSNQRDRRDGDINTIAQRVLRIDGLNAADAWALQDRATAWVRELNPTFSEAQVLAEVAKTMGLTQAQIDGLDAAIRDGRIAATQDITSKGDEIEINFNPVRAWTVSASASRDESKNLNAGTVIEEWLNERLPIWTKIEDPRFTAASPGAAGLPVGANGKLLWYYIKGSAFTAAGYNATQSAADNFVPFIEGPLAVYRQLEGKPRPQLSKYKFKVSTRYQLAGITDNKYLKNMSVGGSVQWNDKKAIGFLGKQSLPDKITQLDPTKPVYTPAETYVDLFVNYRTKLFRDKVRASFQLNAKNVTEGGGRLLTTAVFPDGTPLAYRIIDPRQFILSVSFEL
jgi:hypothetical protein